MKRVFFIILGLIINISTLSAQKTIYLDTKKEIIGIEKTTPIREIEKRQDGVVVTYRFNKIALKNDPLYSSAKTIIIDGFWPNNNVGEPAVLSRWDTFVVPDTSAKIVVIDSAFIEFPLEISPARPLLTNSGNDSYSRSNVMPITSYEGFSPSSLISNTRNDNYRGQNLLDVCVTPVQYDYVNKKVRVFTLIQYGIRYNAVDLENSISRLSRERVNGNTFLDNIALNVPSLELFHGSNVKSPSLINFSSNYLIVSTPKYSTAVNRFAEWKRTLGFDVKVEMRESWDTTMVKNFVHEAYVTDSIEYLLIIGGHSDVPGVIRNRYFNGKDHYHPTDLYYGCMTNGYTPDIFRGRILANTCEEAMTIIDKIINYEKNPVTDESFYRTSVHCAYFQDDDQYVGNVITRPKDGYEDRRFVLTSERIRDGMLSVIDSITRVYKTENGVNPTNWNNGTFANGEGIPEELKKPRFAWDGDSTRITTCINQKAFYVLMRDHGSEDCWGDPSYTNSCINNLSNGNYLPVVFSICCFTGKFDVSNCFCENFLKKKNGGCVAIYGATQSSLSGPNDVMAEGMFDAIWPSLNLRPQFGIINASYSPTPTPTFRLGQILDQGLKRSDEAYLNTSCAWYPRYTSELFHCFGDPSMMIYTAQPTVYSNAVITRQSDGMIYVNTGGVRSKITFYNRRTGEVFSCIGYTVSHTGDSETSVCISAHNKIPYLDAGTLYIQNQTLNNGGYYEAKVIKVGKHVTNTQPVGEAVFSHGDYHLVGKEIKLNSGTTISVGTSMEIKNN